MVTYPINGVDYPLALTLGAMEKLDALLGGMEHVDDAFTGKSTVGIIQTVVAMLRILMEGGRDYIRGLDQEAMDPPSEEQMLALLFPKDIKDAKAAIFAAMAEGMGRTVDVEPNPKNAAATPGQ